MHGLTTKDRRKIENLVRRCRRIEAIGLLCDLRQDSEPPLGPREALKLVEEIEKEMGLAAKSPWRRTGVDR